MSLHYVENVRSSGADILNNNADDNFIERFVINEALTAGFSRILTEKIVNLKGADKDEVIDKEIPR